MFSLICVFPHCADPQIETSSIPGSKHASIGSTWKRNAFHLPVRAESSGDNTRCCSDHSDIFVRGGGCNCVNVNHMRATAVRKLCCIDGAAVNSFFVCAVCCLLFAVRPAIPVRPLLRVLCVRRRQCACRFRQVRSTHRSRHRQ